MYLADTDVVSAGAPTKATVGALVAWMGQNSAYLYMSVVSVTEIEAGIAKLSREGATRKADALAVWLGTLLDFYGGRVLPLDLRTARMAGTLSDLARGKGHSPGLADVAIAATAKAHGLTILTRNVRHFGPLEVAFIDPFERLPPSHAI